MATNASHLGTNLLRRLTGRVTSSMKAAMGMLDVATDGTQEATKFILTDSNVSQGVMKVTGLHLGTSGSEDQISATGAEFNQAFDLDTKGEVVTDTRILTVADHNKVMFLSDLSGFTMTLPLISTLFAGWRIRIIIKTTATSNGYLVTENGSDNNVIVTNNIVELEVDTGDNAPSNTGHTTITLVNGSAVLGDWLDIECDKTKFYVHGMTNVDGGITLA